jgi:4-hydroxy-tetrahydrodipicolinate synthase
MAKKWTAKDIPGGVWSAAPTPFTARMDIDVDSVERMVTHHLRLGVKGLFLSGTNGEGPWLTDRRRRTLVRSIAQFTNGRIPVAVQVTDNSAARMLENMHAAKADGADIAVIAPPFFMMNITPRTVLDVYVEAIRNSPLPVGVYDRGKYSSVMVPDSVLKDIYDEKNVIMIKDSSTMPQRMKIALAAKRRRPDVKLLDGWEFNCVDYLEAGYDGLLLGGGVFNGYLAGMLMNAVAAGELGEARRLQARMNRLMYAVYGGRKIRCWLAGEKQLLVEMGIFRTARNCLGYAVTNSCRRAIRRMLKQEAAVLLP